MASQPTSRAFAPEAVLKRQLDNGLTLLVLPDDAVPALAYTTHWRVGSRNERPGITGISHLFEHLMFTGAKKHGPGRFDVIVESNGGMNNAYTTHDVTAYYEVVPSDALAVILDLELDRMRDVELTERSLKSERQVVKEERRMRTDDSPAGALHEVFLASAFIAHPYRWPVIGWMADIDAITVEDIRDYFHVHYAPNNAVVVVSGDVDGPRALDEIAGVLSALEAGPARPPVVRSEPPQRGERRVVLRKEAQLATFLCGWHACDAASPDVPALDVLQTLLAEGDSGRLRRRLVLEEEVAVDVGVEFPWMADPGLFIVAVTVRPDVEPARAEAALHAELARLVSEPVPELELRKALNQLRAGFYRRLKTNEGRADLLGSAEILLGSHRALFEMPERYAAVTPDDVARVARAVLREDNRTVATLLPLPAQAGAGAAPDAEAGGD